MLVLVALGAAAGGTVARASAVGHHGARLAPADEVVLASSFHRMAGVTAIWASGDYVLLSKAAWTPSVLTGWVVINQRLGTSTLLDASCHVDALGPPWVLIGCPKTSDPYGPYNAELYSLADGTLQTVTPSPGVPQCTMPPGDYAGPICAYEPDGVGTSWIKWDASCYNCAVTSYFQNIQTGQLRHDPTNATTYADLNSPTLAHKTCSGVHLMPAYPLRWGSLTPDGQFALVGAGELDVFLERCGTRMQRRLIGESSESTALAWNAGAVVWQTVTSHLSGVFLPSLQKFTIPLPSAIVRPRGASEPIGVLGLSSPFGGDSSVRKRDRDAGAAEVDHRDQRVGGVESVCAV